MTRILIADDHERLRVALRCALESVEPCVVVGEAANGREALQLTQAQSPDVVLMDVAMPLMNGIEATSQITAKRLPTKVIAVSMHEDSCYVAQMLNAGARGYLLKYSAAEGLDDAITTVLDGQIYLGPGVEPPWLNASPPAMGM